MGLRDRPVTRLGGSRLLAFLSLAACPLAQPSAAVPAAEYTVTLNQGTPQNGPGTFTSFGASGEVQNVPAPFAFAHVVDQGTSHAQVQYFFRVNGPAAQVPIRIDGRIEFSAGGALFEEDMIWGVSASIAAQALDGPLGAGSNEIDSEVRQISCNPNSVGPIPVPLPIPTCSATVQGEDVSLTLLTQAGGDNRVNLLALANNQEAFFADFEVSVDPVISFAPGFDATGYSIELSDGVGNTVPEAGGPLLTATGFGLLLAVRLGKRSRESARAQ
jgi:hypothetical protein